MQYTDNQGVLFHFPKEYNVRLIFVPPEFWREFISRTSPERVLGKSFEAVTQSMQIRPRLLNAEVYNRVFKNVINIGARLPA
jgi:hypothetical protein